MMPAFKILNPKGQTLVIILLGTSVALTVALAVSVRTISTLKQTTTSAQAQEALAAAEAGAEVGLGRLKDGSCTGVEPACTVAEGSSPTDPGYLSGSKSYYWFTITATGSSSDPYLMDLAKDVTQEVKLDNGLNGKTAKVCWWDQSLDGAETANAVEVIYLDGSGNMKKFAYNGGVAPSPTNGFGSASSHNVEITFPSNNKKITFKNCQDVPSSAMSGPKILRIKAFYANFSSVVVPNGGGTLPAQGYQIMSYGKTADGSVRKAVRVTKSLPSLPAIFDYGLYSGSTSQPLSK